MVNGEIFGNEWVCFSEPRVFMGSLASFELVPSGHRHCDVTWYIHLFGVGHRSGTLRQLERSNFAEKHLLTNMIALQDADPIPWLLVSFAWTDCTVSEVDHQTFDVFFLSCFVVCESSASPLSFCTDRSPKHNCESILAKLLMESGIFGQEHPFQYIEIVCGAETLSLSSTWLFPSGHLRDYDVSKICFFREFANLTSIASLSRMIWPGSSTAEGNQQWKNQDPKLEAKVWQVMQGYMVRTANTEIRQ